MVRRRHSVGGLGRPAVGPGTQEGGAPAQRQAHHAGGVRDAFQHVGSVVGVGVGEMQAVRRLNPSGDILRGELGFFGIGGIEAAGMGDGVAMPLGGVRGGAGRGRGKHGVERVDELEVGVPGEAVDRLG